MFWFFCEVNNDYTCCPLFKLLQTFNLMQIKCILYLVNKKLLKWNCPDKEHSGTNSWNIKFNRVVFYNLTIIWKSFSSASWTDYGYLFLQYILCALLPNPVSSAANCSQPLFLADQTSAFKCCDHYTASWSTH